jgi:hypothetical protein
VQVCNIGVLINFSRFKMIDSFVKKYFKIIDLFQFL